MSPQHWGGNIETYLLIKNVMIRGIRLWTCWSVNLYAKECTTWLKKKTHKVSPTHTRALVKAKIFLGVESCREVWLSNIHWDQIKATHTWKWTQNVITCRMWRQGMYDLCNEEEWYHPHSMRTTLLLSVWVIKFQVYTVHTLDLQFK